MSPTMRQIAYHRFGNPEEVLRLEEVPWPVAGPGEVIVRLEAAPVHLADLKQIRGAPWFDRLPPPQVPGFEGVGRIESLGAGVTGFAPGERVFLPPGFGAWREAICTSAADLWRAPEAVDAAQLALVGINVPTAWLLLDSVVDLAEGDWIIQNAANSNVGYHLIRLARRRGIHTVNLVRRPELLAGLEAIGGTLNLVDGPDLAAQLAGRVPLARLRLAIDAIAGDATLRLAACLAASGGIVAAYGMLSGEPCRIAPEMLMLDGISLVGFQMNRTLAGLAPERIAAMRADIGAYLEAMPPEARIAGRYRFAQVADAVRHAGQTQALRDGKIILVP